MLTLEEIDLIAEAVVERLQAPKQTLTLEQAAKYMGIRAKHENLSSTFSRFSNPKNYKNPLKYSRVGKSRVYRIEDLDEFMKSKGRGF